MSLIVWNLRKKKKADVWFILLDITQICFYGSDQLTQQSDMSIKTENVAKMMYKLPQYQFCTIIIWHMSEKCNFKHTVTDAAVSLSCYVYVFAISTYLTTVYQYLRIFFSQKLYVIGKIFIRWSEKSIKPLKK